MIKLAILFALMLPSADAGETNGASELRCATAGEEQGLIAVAAPTTPDEALERLEAILGAFNSKAPVLWLVKNERRSASHIPETCADLGKPADEEAEQVTSIMQDLISYGTPFRMGDRVAFDSVGFRKSWSTTESGEDVWGQMRHSAIRTSFQLLSSGKWKAEVRALTHSHPNLIDAVSDTGAVVWLEDGIKINSFAAESMIARDGELCDAVVHVTRTYRNIEGKLEIDGCYRLYGMAETPDGSALSVPDFTNPLSEPLHLDYSNASNQLGSSEEWAFGKKPQD